jgi:hypothetical protein
MAICREIMSNCLDAHREAKIPETPFEIKIEHDNFLIKGSKTLMFRDFGLGMSPKKIKNVYTEYGTSDKRENNKLIGGFGLGSKSPFSYCDSFFVITRNEGTEYIYNAAIGADQKGDMLLISSKKSSDPSGTDIIVPIHNESDVYNFQNHILYYIKYWKTKPKLLNCNHVEANLKTTIVFEDENFLVLADSYVDSFYCLIDGIVYPLDHSKLSSKEYQDFRWINRYNYGCFVIFPKFKTGDLALSANRETIYYDDESKTTIAKKLQTISQAVSIYTKKFLDTKVFSFVEKLKLLGLIFFNDNEFQASFKKEDLWFLLLVQHNQLEITTTISSCNWFLKLFKNYPDKDHNKTIKKLIELLPFSSLRFFSDNDSSKSTKSRSDHLKKIISFFETKDMDIIYKSAETKESRGINITISDSYKDKNKEFIQIKEYRPNLPSSIFVPKEKSEEFLKQNRQNLVKNVKKIYPLLTGKYYTKESIKTYSEELDRQKSEISFCLFKIP